MHVQAYTFTTIAIKNILYGEWLYNHSIYDVFGTSICSTVKSTNVASLNVKQAGRVEQTFSMHALFAMWNQPMSP